MTLEENIKSILTTCFTGFKDEFINIATYRIIEIIDNAQITEQQAIDKLHETGWLIKHDKEMTERPHGKWIKHDFPDCDGFWDYKCSECEKVYGGEYNYCPNCGAKMGVNDEVN
jgi:hypothetical protein